MGFLRGIAHFSAFACIVCMFGYSEMTTTNIMQQGVQCLFQMQYILGAIFFELVALNLKENK